MKRSVSFKEFNAGLNLEPIVFSLTHRKEGPEWSIEKCRLVEKWYRRYFYLVSLYPESGLVPSKDIDVFWHTHILDTRKYMEDCDHLLGRYFHHFPYFGMRGKEDRKNLKRAFEETELLYLKHFGESLRSLEIADCGALCNEPTPRYGLIHGLERPVLH